MCLGGVVVSAGVDAGLSTVGADVGIVLPIKNSAHRSK